jgi:hypothetical protein
MLMEEKVKILIFSAVILLNALLPVAKAQPNKADSVNLDNIKEQKSDHLYDNPKSNMVKNKLTNYFYKYIYSPPKNTTNKKEYALD